ncbi:MAG: DNA replication/repair protein RecF [Steroidobacteraceae bacterium]
MTLAALRVDDLRIVQGAQLAFAPGLNLISGANGSGKTSLLEAIFLLGRGRSFRTRHTERLIRHGAEQLLVFGETAAPDHKLGLAYSREGGATARIDGRTPQSLAELPAYFFVEAIDPEIHRLVSGAPADRRRWLDWGVFHVEPGFLDHWIRYGRALKQRNAALKSGMDPRPWSGELVLNGERIASQRQGWLDGLLPVWETTVEQLSGLPVQLTGHRGWAQQHASLSDALDEAAERDRQRGTTTVGPHRADISLRLGGELAREVLSRGQQKLVASAMVIALLRRLRELGEGSATLLLDDPAAELDSERLGNFVSLVRSLEGQLVVTTLQASSEIFGKPDQLFHVERGGVKSA